MVVAEARRGKTRTGLTDEQRRIPPKEAAKSVRYLVPEALVYSNYGFSNVLQERINGYAYLASRLKDSLENKINLTTILGTVSP